MNNFGQKKKLAKKKAGESTKDAAPELSKSDKKKIADGKFSVSDVDALRLQHLSTKLTLWSERYVAAQKVIGETLKSADGALSEFEAAVADVKLRHGLGEEHNIGLSDENAGLVSVSQNPPETEKKDSKDA